MADLRRVFGDAAGLLLVSSSRGVLRHGPDAAAMADAVRRGNDELAALA